MSTIVDIFPQRATIVDDPDRTSTNAINGQPVTFARAFGDALYEFLKENGISQTDAAKRMGLEKSGKSRITSYCRPSKNGQSRSPDAQILCLACVRLGFKFRYNEYLISAQSFEDSQEQLEFEFSRQFNLTNKQGTVSVTVKRPPGRIDLFVSLAAHGV